MLRNILCICGIFILIFSFTGCTTIRKKDLEQQALRNQIRALEIQVREKDQELMNLREALDRQIQEREELGKKITTTKIIPEVKSRPKIKQIQIALKNAGYDPGPTDGKMGKRTREAIKAFQKANGLAVDGKVGRLTWRLLGKYLYKKIK